MTKLDYDTLQLLLSKKLYNPPNDLTGKRLEGYEDGIKTAKSILHSFCSFERLKTEGESE